MKYVLILLLVLPLAACGAAHAAPKTAPVLPPLDVPPPPPRTVQSPPLPEPPQPVGDLPPAAPVVRPVHPPAGKETPKETAKPEPRPETPVETVPPPVPPVVPQLQTPQAADGPEMARNVRTMIDRANGLLGTVNYGPLSQDRKTQYDTAKRFLQQAEVALKAKNYVFAQSLAEKADTLAQELAGK
ncbi:MAG TPA: hypothetical protein VFX12_03570 [Vicinamibacterales bacterium]|nr:hypothetical protein [Vicinamibacterales bacterium]